PGDHRLYNSSDGREAVVVETVRLDDFFHGKEAAIDLIKMDIQGAEMAALEGMADTLRRVARLTLITEFWPDGLKNSGFSPEEFLRTLTRHEFRLYVLDVGQGFYKKSTQSGLWKHAAPR